VRILVTGAAGFIGSTYVRGLLSGTLTRAPVTRVTVVDKLTYAASADNLAPVLADPRLTFVEGDVCDAGLMADTVPGHDVVVNFAAESHVDRSIARPQDFVATNVVGSHTLLRAAKDAGVRLFLQVSTDEVYGSVDFGSWTEHSPLAPNSPYAASKAAADLMAGAYARTYGMDVRITRCGNNYGPAQHPEKLIPRFITNLLDGQSLPVYGDGRNVRDWIHVDDHCRAIQLVLEKGAPGEVYNVGGGTELPNIAVAKQLIDACGAAADSIRHVTDRPGHDFRYSLDGGKLAALGFAPQVDFATGLAQTIEWYRAHRAWWEPIRAAATAAPGVD
jgi:dTDP-glucose 4,6-dehydratase